MKALGSYIVIRKEVEEVKNQSGLIMTEFTDKSIRYKLATVVSVGIDTQEIEEGDKIYYDAAAGSEIRIDGERLIVISDRQVVVKL